MLNEKSIRQIMPNVIYSETKSTKRLSKDRQKKLKETLKDCFFDKSKYKEIADCFDVNIATVYNTARRLTS